MMNFANVLHGNSHRAVEEHLSEIINFWLENQKDAFYEIGYYELGDFYLALER
jgi:hypothetical protein